MRKPQKRSRTTRATAAEREVERYIRERAPKRSQGSLKKNPRIEEQGALLLEQLTDRYEAVNMSKDLFTKLKILYPRNIDKLAQSKAGNNIHYLNNYLERLIKILEEA